jgi:hypothetical protein
VKDWLTRRSVLAAPGVLAGCTPEGSEPVNASGGDGTTSVPEPEQAYAQLPEAVRRRLGENAAFANAPLPGISSYQQLLVDGREMEFRAGRIGPVNYLRGRMTQTGRPLRAGSCVLSIGGIGDALGLFSADVQLIAGRERASLRVWEQVEQIEGSLFPLAVGNRFTAAIIGQRLFDWATVRQRDQYELSIEIVRRWRPWEIWRAIVLGELSLGLSGSDLFGFPVLIQGDFWELRRGRNETHLYSEILAADWASGVESSPNESAASIASSQRQFILKPLIGFGNSRSLEPWRLRLTPAGQVRLDAARVAISAFLSDAAARSAQLSSADRARSAEIFRNAFIVWQAGNFRAAYLGFTAGLQVDPANGVAHFYSGSSAASMYTDPNRRATLGDTPIVVATRHLRDFHMRAAAQFAPTTREGIEAAAFRGL